MLDKWCFRNFLSILLLTIILVLLSLDLENRKVHPAVDFRRAAGDTMGTLDVVLSYEVNSFSACVESARALGGALFIDFPESHDWTLFTVASGSE